MNNSLNEYLRFNFELNIELNHFLARFNVKMNNQNVSPTPKVRGAINDMQVYRKGIVPQSPNNYKYKYMQVRPITKNNQ